MIKRVEACTIYKIIPCSVVSVFSAGTKVILAPALFISVPALELNLELKYKFAFLKLELELKIKRNFIEYWN